MSANPNENCLEGWQCPHCGSYGPFKVVGSAWFTVSDDGTDDHEDVEWTDDSPAECVTCGYAGTVKQFKRSSED